MPQRLFANAGAQSTCASAITSAQTTVTLQSASGFPPVVSGQQFSVIILDSGNPAYNANSPLATPYEYQQVNAVSGNVLTFGPGGGAASRVAYAGTTPKAFFAGAVIAQATLADDFNASFPIKLGEQLLTVATGTVTFSGIDQRFRHLELVIYAKTNGSAGGGNAVDCRLQLNGDASAAYGSLIQYNTNATPTPAGGWFGAQSAIQQAYVVPNTNATAQVGVARLQIPGYTQTAFGARIIMGQSARADGGSGEFRQCMGSYSSSLAISSLSTFPAFDSFAIGSLFTLYGVP